MPFVPVPNVVMAEMRMLWLGQKVENTLYFDFGSVPIVGDMNSLAIALTDWWDTAYAPLANTNVSLTEVVVTSLASDSAPQVSHAPVVFSNGDNTSPSMPNNVSICISFRTASRGRSFRGRNYFAGLSENQVVGNQIEEVVIGDLIDAYNQLKTGDILAIAEWTVVSRFHGVDSVTGHPIPRTTGLSTVVTNVVVVDDIVDSMRRRLPGRGT